MTGEAIQVLLNGEAIELPFGSTLGELLAAKGIQSLSGLACERNGEIVAPNGALTCALASGDDIVLVRIVGGG